jgi:hypothetical protein
LGKAIVGVDRNDTKLRYIAKPPIDMFIRLRIGDSSRRCRTGIHTTMGTWWASVEALALGVCCTVLYRSAVSALAAA